MQFSKTYRKKTRQRANPSLSVREVPENHNFFKRVLQIVYLYTDNTFLKDLAKTFQQKNWHFFARYLEKTLKKHNSYQKNVCRRKHLRTIHLSKKFLWKSFVWAGEHSFSCPDNKTLPKGRKDFDQTPTLIKKAKSFHKNLFFSKSSFRHVEYNFPKPTEKISSTGRLFT